MENNSIGEKTDRGFNMQVFSGKPFYPLSPRVEEIEIEDIAQALSKLCRFNGHTKQFYSVAQHSCLVASQYKKDPLSGLLHDASEAYMGDCIRPVKYMLKEWLIYEDQLQSVINDKFDLDTFEPKLKFIDTKMAWTEKRDLLNPSINVDWGPEIEPFDFKIIPWSPEESYEYFMEDYYKYAE